MDYQKAIEAAIEFARTTEDYVSVFLKRAPIDQCLNCGGKSVDVLHSGSTSQGHKFIGGSAEFGFCGCKVVGIMTTASEIVAWVNPTGGIAVVDPQKAGIGYGA